MGIFSKSFSFTAGIALGLVSWTTIVNVDTVAKKLSLRNRNRAANLGRWAKPQTRADDKGQELYVGDLIQIDVEIGSGLWSNYVPKDIYCYVVKKDDRGFVQFIFFL
jgi:hypothetical protein